MSQMPKVLFILLFSLGALIAFIVYCMALIGWIQDYLSGQYSRNYFEAVFETGVLIVYTYLGIRFFNRNISPFS